MSLRTAGQAVVGGLFALAPVLAIAQVCVTESQIPSSTPTAQFTDHADGTVTDNRTRLMWAKCPLGRSGADCSTGVVQALNWGDALQAGEESELAGHNDWRLPNVKELSSIIELRCGAPAVNAEVFPNTSLYSYWTGSPSAINPIGAWVVVFAFAGETVSDSRNSLRMVRLVRDSP